VRSISPTTRALIILLSAIGLLGLVPAMLSAAAGASAVAISSASPAECVDEASPAPSLSSDLSALPLSSPGPSPDPSPTSPDPSPTSSPDPSPAPSEQVPTVSYRFRITTDANSDIGRITEILASPNSRRNLINNEVAENDPKGCYLLRFDTRTLTQCTVQTAIRTANGRTMSVTVKITTKAMTDDNGNNFTRFFVAFSPKTKDAIYTIRLLCSP